VKAAISTDGDFVSAHFGRCSLYTIVDIEDGKVENKKTVENPGHQPGNIPQFLHQMGVTCIICGGMGARAAGFFKEFGIETIVGVDGKINETIEALAKSSLKSGESLCSPGAGKGYGVEKSQCDHPDEKDCDD